MSLNTIFVFFARDRGIVITRLVRICKIEFKIEFRAIKGQFWPPQKVNFGRPIKMTIRHMWHIDRDIIGEWCDMHAYQTVSCDNTLRLWHVTWQYLNYNLLKSNFWSKLHVRVNCTFLYQMILLYQTGTTPVPQL